MEKNRNLVCVLTVPPCNTPYSYWKRKGSYTLHCEYMGRYIPLLKAVLISTSGYKVVVKIKPAFPVTAPSDDMWAHPVQTASTISQTQEVNGWQVFQHLFCNKRVLPLTDNPLEPVLAVIEGSTLMNRYQFSSDFRNNATDNMGNLNIYNHRLHYLIWTNEIPRLRSLTLTLTDPALQLTSKDTTWHREERSLPPYTFYSGSGLGGRCKQATLHNFHFEYEKQEVRMSKSIIIIVESKIKFA